MKEFYKRDFLSDILMVLGSAFFLFIIVQPFLAGSGQPPLGGGGYASAKYYSFKMIGRGYAYTYHDYALLNVESDFGGYWFNQTPWMIWRPPLDSYILMATFVLQVITMILGCITLLTKSKVRFIPLISSITTVFFLTWLYLTMNPQDAPLAQYQQQWSLANGYWFTFVSIVFFSLSTIFGLVHRAQQQHQENSDLRSEKRFVDS
jgi:hypothetical protein